MKYSDCNINPHGDICCGDVILFTETVWSGGRRPVAIGTRKIMAEIIQDSYGPKNQHTFTLRLLKTTGCEAAELRKTAKKRNGKILRKGRVIHKHGVKRAPWDDEQARGRSLREKHTRGDMNSKRKFQRREYLASL